MADKSLQKEYRNLVKNLLKRVRKRQRQLEEQQREKAIRMREPAEKANEDAARELTLARQQLQEDRASSSSASTPLFTAALVVYNGHKLGVKIHIIEFLLFCLSLPAI